MFAKNPITFSENEIGKLLLSDILLECPGHLVKVHAPVFNVKVAGNVVQMISRTLHLVRALEGATIIWD